MGFLCSYCNKTFTYLSDALRCSGNHMRNRDEYYKKYEDEMKLQQAANAAGQKKLV